MRSSWGINVFFCPDFKVPHKLVPGSWKSPLNPDLGIPKAEAPRTQLECTELLPDTEFPKWTLPLVKWL